MAEYTHRRQTLTLPHSFTDLFCKEMFLILQNKCKVSSNIIISLKSEDNFLTKQICQ